MLSFVHFVFILYLFLEEAFSSVFDNGHSNVSMHYFISFCSCIIYMSGQNSEKSTKLKNKIQDCQITWFSYYIKTPHELAAFQLL